MSATLSILGGGCTGPLLAVLLARRGHAVRIYERRADPRRAAAPPGRSINLALAARGIAALERANLMPVVQPLLLPMRGRMLHELPGGTRLLPYGQRPHELLWSVSRAELNRTLLDAAVAEGVEIHFGHACVGANFAGGWFELEELATARRLRVPMTAEAPVFGADGAGSALRAAMVAAGLASAREDVLAHGYKELAIAAGPGGQHRLDPGALHIWPRGGYMLIALPNRDGTFTATVFLANRGAAPSFAALGDGAAVARLFARDFPDVRELIPDLETQFAAHAIGRLVTIHTRPWHAGGRALLLGDAAHALVPFHGQGMNCAFEDCRVLAELLAAGGSGGWPDCFVRFDALRRDDAAAIARMALANYVEMRATVSDPQFALQQQLALALERRHPDRFIPRYSMVMFHAEIGYATAEQRGAVQAGLLAAATRNCTRLADVDLPGLDAVVNESLPPVSAAGAPA